MTQQESIGNTKNGKSDMDRDKMENSIFPNTQTGIIIFILLIIILIFVIILFVYDIFNTRKNK